MAWIAWTEAEIEYLEEKWGEISIPTIAKNLNRSINAIKIKAIKIGLGRHLHNMSEITFSQLLQALGVNQSYSWCKESWTRRGLKIKYRKSVEKKFRVVDIKDFWQWAQQNKNILNFTNFEKYALGKEPDWVDAKRRADIQAQRYKKTPWAKTEDQLLISLLNQYKYGYAEISEKLLRTEGAIKRRMYSLNLKQRPVKANNHIPWESEKIDLALNLHNQGFKAEYISKKVNRSACAVRGLLERKNIL